MPQDRSARRELCNIAQFRPTFSAFDKYVRLNTGSLSVMLILMAVYSCRYAMQRDVYATPSSGDGGGIFSSFAFKAVQSKAANF